MIRGIFPACVFRHGGTPEVLVPVTTRDDESLLGRLSGLRLFLQLLRVGRPATQRFRLQRTLCLFGGLLLWHWVLNDRQEPHVSCMPVRYT